MPLAFLPSAFSTRLLATSKPPDPPPIILGSTSANSMITEVCSSPPTLLILAISIETASTCLGSSLAISLPASSCGKLISSTAALRSSFTGAFHPLRCRRTQPVLQHTSTAKGSPARRRRPAARDVLDLAFAAAGDRCSAAAWHGQRWTASHCYQRVDS